MVMGRGLHPPGWAVGYRLAVVLTLAAAARQVTRCRARCLASTPTPVITPAGADARERPILACTARPSAPADQDAVRYGQRSGDRRSAADLRLRFAGGVLIPFLRCRWSHVGAKRRIRMRK
jgi:hypothetical protein